MSRNHQNTGPNTNGPSRSQQAKLVLLGDMGVGKSSIALRFVRGQFQNHMETTIGAAFLTQTVQVQGRNIKFDIWDTAGQERYHSLAPMYYRGAQAAVVVYDINDSNTFNRAINWVRELRQQVTGNLIIILAGNKADLASENRAVLMEDGKAFADENGLMFAEVSAKTGLAISDMFMMIAHKLAGGGGGQSPGQRVRLDGEKEEGSSRCKC